MKLSFVIPSRPGTDRTPIKAEAAALDLAGHTAEFLYVEGTLPPLQRNVAIRRTTGDYVFLLDDDLVIPDGLVPRTLDRFRDEQTAVVGGPNLTPAGDSPFAQLSGELLASPLATGPTSDRWRRSETDMDATERKLHGCFLCFRGDLLRDYLFVEDLFPNDENELMSRLRRDRYRLCYASDCFVYHKRRTDLSAHTRQVYTSGRGRGELVRRSGLGGQFPYLAPLGLLLSVAALAIPVVPRPVVAVLLGIYAVLAAIQGLGSCIRRRRLYFLWTGPLMVVSHIAYGVGLVRGILTTGGRTGQAAVVEVVEIDG